MLRGQARQWQCDTIYAVENNGRYWCSSLCSRCWLLNNDMKSGGIGDAWSSFLVSSAEVRATPSSHCLSDRRHSFEVQAPDPDLSPGPPPAHQQVKRDRRKEKTSEDAVAISPLPPHYHRRVQRGRRCHVEHPKNCLRKGKALQVFVSVTISPPPKSVGRVGLSLDCCSNFSSSLFSPSCLLRNVLCT